LSQVGHYSGHYVGNALFIECHAFARSDVPPGATPFIARLIRTSSLAIAALHCIQHFFGHQGDELYQAVVIYSGRSGVRVGIY
jgi:hypothetical protein